MLVLAIDTATASTAAAVVALDRTGGLYTRARRQHVDPRAHGEQLAPQIEAVLAESEVRAAELTAIVAGVGPGPFTGLRVGLATAKSIGQALDIPCYGVCSLDGIGAVTEGRALVATDARRQEVYWAVYADGRQLTPPAVDRPGELVTTLAAHRVGQAYGEGALRYRDLLGLPVAPVPVYPAPSTLVSLAADRIIAGAPGEPLTPCYLRRPDVAEPRPPKPVLPSMKVAPLRASEIDELLPIEEDLFGAERWSVNAFQGELDQNHYYLVARDSDQRVLGYGGLAVMPPSSAWVNTLAVRRDAQGRGIGKALLVELLAEAERRAVKKVLLEVAVTNVAAKRLYERHGFVPLSIRRGYYQPSNTDALVMVRE